MLLRSRLLRLAVAVIAAGTLFQGLSCSPQDLFAFARDFNPCGTILNCNPVSYRFLTSGYDGPGVDPDIDPACTYPPYCNRMTPGSDPFSPP
jgi:hypothetical protein